MLFCYEELGFDRGEPFQEECWGAYDNHDEIQRICLKACKGPGKTAMLAGCGLHFLSMFPFPKIVCTSITGDNLRDNLWAEFAKWMKRSKFLSSNFIWSKERIYHKDHPEDWFISARKWSKDADPEQQANALAGIHAEYVLFILDEAGGIPDSVAAAAEGGLATGTICKLIIAGNPTHCSGPLYRAAMYEQDMWWVKNITADPEDPNRATRVSKKWAEEQIRKYGRKSPFVMVNVLSEFPVGAIDTVITPAQFIDACNRYTGKLVLPRRPRVLGCDIARFGDDINAIAKRAGGYLEGFEDWQGEDTEFTADRIYEIYNEFNADAVRVDDIGVGGGVTDKLARRGVPVVGIDVGESPIDNEEDFLNLRAELTKDFSDLFLESNPRIAINPKIREETTLMVEGTTLKVMYMDNSNKRKVQSKAAYKKITKRSPNYLDAAVAAYADRVIQQSCGTSTGEEGQYRGEHDPYPRKVDERLHHVEGHFGGPRRRTRLWDRRY